MGQDSRKFRVWVGRNTAALWRVLDAVESTATDAAHQYEYQIAKRVTIEHSTGEYERRAVTDARTSSERNGFRPLDVRFFIWQLGPEPEDTSYRDSELWVSAIHHRILGYVDIKVILGTEIEVNGVFSMLQDAVKAAIGSKQSGTNNAVVKQPIPWRHVLNHTWTITLVGGIVVGLLFLWLTLEMS